MVVKIKKTALQPRLVLVGSILYFLVAFTKNDAYAAVALTDCLNDLDTEGETYILQNNILQDCTVTANNVIIDGQSLYSIDDEVIATKFGVTINDLTGLTRVYANTSEYGGTGGPITIDNSTITTVESTGGYSYGYAGGLGGTIIITDSNIGTVTSDGGGSDTADGGAGGAITITDSVIDDVTSEGGLGPNGTGGAGGIITLNDTDADNVTSEGGYGEYGNGGAGGNILILSSSDAETVISRGGAGGDGNGGAGGNITITDSDAYSSTTVGGAGSTGNDAGDGGNITITDSVINSANASGGNGYRGGDGGDIVVEGTTASYLVKSDGGNTSGEYLDGGVAGTVTLTTSSVPDIEAIGGTGYYGTSTGGNVVLTDSDVDRVTNTGDNANGTFAMTDNDPTITVTGDDPLEIDFDAVYAELGATATDARDGTITDDIVTTGAVGATAGDYIITYEVTDEGSSTLVNTVANTDGPNTVQATRTVTRLAEVIVPETSTSSSSSAQSRAIAKDVFAKYYAAKNAAKNDTPSETPEDNSCPVTRPLTQPLKQGARDGEYNSFTGEIVSDVALLQEYINKILGEAYESPAGPVDGIYGPLTAQGVKRMQEALKDRYEQDLGVYGVDGIVGNFTTTAISNWCKKDEA